MSGAVNQGAEGGVRTVLFADISDSTRLYDALGTETARLALLRYLEVMAAAVDRSGGMVVSSLGRVAQTNQSVSKFNAQSTNLMT